jgi:hypothetical protein
MPNDPRHKFKKQVYDMSRNVMYYATGGGGIPTGGGGGGGGPPGPDPKKGPTETIFTPNKKPVIPVDPVYPIRPFPTPFDPRPYRPPGIAERTLDSARLRYLAEMDARNRARIVPMPKDDILDDILVDDPTPGVKPVSVNVRDIFGEATPFTEAAAGGRGKAPPRVVIKPVDLTNPPVQKLPKKLINPKDIDPNAQGTPREQIDYLNRQRQIAEGKAEIANSLEKASPLEARIAAKMYEMKMGGATQEAMNAMAKQMREQRGKFVDIINRPPQESPSTSASSSAKSTPERSFIEDNIQMINEDLKNPTLTREEVAEYNKLKADFENQLKMLADEKAANILKEAASKLQLQKATTDLEAAAKSLKITKEDLVKGGELEGLLNEQRETLKFINEELAKPKSVQEVQILKQQKLDAEKNIIKAKRDVEEHARKLKSKVDKLENVVQKEIAKAPPETRAAVQAESKTFAERVFGKKQVVETPKISRALVPKPKPAPAPAPKPAPASKPAPKQYDAGDYALNQKQQDYIKALKNNDRKIYDIEGEIEDLYDNINDANRARTNDKIAQLRERIKAAELNRLNLTKGKMMEDSLQAIKINEKIIAETTGKTDPQSLRDFNEAQKNIRNANESIRKLQEAAGRGGRTSIEAIDEGAGLGIGAGREAQGMTDEEFANTLEQARIQSEREIPFPLDPKTSEALARTKEMYEIMRKRDEGAGIGRAREGSLTTQTLEDSLALDAQVKAMQDRQAASRNAPRDVAPDSAVKAVSTPDYLQVGEPKLDFAKMFERTENLLKQLKEHKATLTAPEESVNRLEQTLERALRELGNENPDAYNKAFAPVDLAEEIEQTKSLIKTNDEQIANAKTPREVARLKKLKDTLERSLRDLKRGKTELYDTKIGELSIKEYGSEMPTSSKIAERLQRVRIADESLGSYLDLPTQRPASSRPSQASSSRPAGPGPPTESPGASPTPSPPELNREVEMESYSQRRALMDTLTRSNYERVDILDTIDELGGTEARGGRVPLDEPIELGDLGGTPSRGGRLPTTDISPPSSGSTTPSGESSGSRTPIEGEGRGSYKPLNPLEMETVPLDNTGLRARPGKGKAPVKAPVKAPQAKLKLPSGRQIQDAVNINVSSKFTNVNTSAAKLGGSLKALGSRVPVLKPPSINTIRAIAGHPVTITATSIGIGIGVSYLMAEYFKAHPATNKFDMYAQQFAVGTLGGASGTFFAHVVTLAGRMGTEIFSGAGALAVGGALVGSLAEAAAVTAAAMVTEYTVEKAMRKYNFSHSVSNAVAAGVSGTGMTIYGAIRGGIPGAIIMMVFSLVNIGLSVQSGIEQDRQELLDAIANADTADAVNGARKQLLQIMTLTNNNDYDAAFAQLSAKNKKALNDRPAEENELFKNTLKYELDPLLKSRGPNPYLTPDAPPHLLEVNYENVTNAIVDAGDTIGTGFVDLITAPIDAAIDREGTMKREEKLKNDAYNEYVEWYVNTKFDPYYARDHPRPTGEGVELLDKDTLYSWRSGAEMSGELAYRQSYNHAMAVSGAKEKVVNQWIKDTRTMGEIEDRDLVDLANLDKDFAENYEKYIVTDATAQLTYQFNQNGTRYTDADPRLLAVAKKNPDALPMLDHYYQVMTTLSKDTGLSIAELARLNALPIDEQNKELGKINRVRETILRGGLLKDKATVDEFNAALIREMSSYGDNFELIMQNINDHEMLMGGSYLYALNKSDLYRQLHLEAPVLVVDNPYAAFTELDYNKNRTPTDTLVYGYRYNLVDEQNQELEDYIQALNKTKNGGATLTDVTERAQFIFDRDKDRYFKGDSEVAKDLNMTLEEYYAEYGYNKRPHPDIAVRDYTETPVAEPDPPEVIAAELERQRQYDAAQAERERQKLLQKEADKKLIVNGVEVDITTPPEETRPIDYDKGETDEQKADRQKAIDADKADTRTLAERQDDPNDRYYIPPQIPASQRAIITQQQQLQYNKERGQTAEEKPKNNFQVIDGQVVNVGPNTRVINGKVYDEAPIVEDTPQQVFAPTQPTTTPAPPKDTRTLAERQNDPNDRFYIPPQLASQRAMITQQQQFQYDAEMRGPTTTERPSSSIKTEMTARPTADAGYVRPPDSDRQTGQDKAPPPPPPDKYFEVPT